MFALMTKETTSGKSLIQGNVALPIKEKFDVTLAELDYRVGAVVKRLAQFWVELPREQRERLYSNPESFARAVADEFEIRDASEKKPHSQGHLKSSKAG